MPQIFLKGISMYQALYRKYRPLVFEDVVGQEHIVTTIKNQIVNNKISHAYMFTGTRGTGKTTCAKILARAVNCEHPVSGNPCNACETCKGILNGSLLDVFEIDAASNNGVDNIRELREDVIFTPASAKYKVYIIDEVHMLSTQAFNALLKTLEEPPAHVIFVFATTEIHKVPQTILSRCQRFDFKRITLDDICLRINYVAQCENFTIDEKACKLIAKLADGAMRDALSILDRCVDGTEHISLQKVESTVGICSYEQILDALNAIVNSDSDAILRFYAECRRNSADPLSLFSELCSYLRDIMLIKLTADPMQFLNYDSEKFSALKDMSEKFNVELIVRSIGVLQNGIYDITKFKDKHIMAEITLIKLTNMQVGVDIDSINARLSRLESGAFEISKAKTVVPKSSEKVVSIPVKPKEPSSAPVTTVNGDFWNTLMNRLANNGGKYLLALLRTVEYEIGDGLIILKCSKNDFAYSVLSQQQNVGLIKNAAGDVSGREFGVVFKEKETAKRVVDDNLSELLSNANDILYEE